MSPKGSTNTNVFKTVPPRQSRPAKLSADQMFCDPKNIRLKAIVDEALARIAMHEEQQKVLLSKIDVIVANLIAIQEQNNALTEELRVANEHVEFLHNQLQLQVLVPGASAFTTTVLPSTEIAPVENASASASAHGPVPIPTPSPTTGSSANPFVYLSYRHHLKYSQVRKLLTTFKIQQSCVLDIAFPERGTFSLLVHNDFKDKITQLFADIGVSVKTDFDPLDHQIIANLARACKPMQENQQITYKLHRQYLLALCLRLPAPLGKSVMRHFCKVESSSLCLPPVCLEKYLEDQNLPYGPQASASAIGTATVM
ncbi:hypothetical protein J3Q64DRAFT_1708763, partial [Phycomyces blakesleeanus]